MKRITRSRGKKILELALKDSGTKPNTDDISENEDSSYCGASEPWSDITDLDPTYRPEKNKNERTLNWILTEDFCSTEKRKENAKEIIQDKIQPLGSHEDTLKSTVLPELYRDFSEKQPMHESNCSNVESSSRSSIIPYIEPIYDMYMDSEVDVPTDTALQENTADGTVKINQLLDPEPPRCQIQSAEVPPQNSISRFIEAVKEKQKKKRTVCKFCRISVTNFERHLCRHHLEEKEVKDYLKFPKNTKEGKQMRRNILALLRYEVSFEKFVQSEEFQPDKLPCAHCKRIIAVKYLRRHYKKCIVHPINQTGRNIRHQAASQTLVACASEHANVTATLRVKKEVFSRMASDEIGFLARKDPLIRHFGEFYLKKHKRAQISLACSNKMRECSRLLIAMRRRIGEPKFSFFQLLDPTLFDAVTLCAKAISGYDEGQKNYKAPSLALHLGTTLQQTCELTTHLLLKKSPEFKCINYEERLKEIKRFRFLVQSQWNNEVASLALKDLAEKKWNTPVMLPLTKDIIKFRNHILEIAERNVALLRKERTDAIAFKKLVDASLAFTILFNRRRIGDVQYVETASYLKNFTANNQTEFMEQLTESEKSLTASYKRVVAGGKGSAAIVILFPPNLQEYINLLLEIRHESDIIPQQNPYLFAYPGVTDQWVRGDVVLKNFAKSCKIANPQAMTSNRLRKQIATMMQIINLDKSEYSQFARFMGHTEKTHQEFYEITQDAYQTAKVAKLLTLFDKGKGTEYRNKTLANIDIDPNNVLVESDDNSENEEGPLVPTTENSTSGNNQECNTSDDETVSKKKKKESNRVRWTAQQKKLVSSHFKGHIKKKKAPKKDECEKLIRKHKDILNTLDWVKIKTFVYNTYTAANNNK